MKTLPTRKLWVIWITNCRRRYCQTHFEFGQKKGLSPGIVLDPGRFWCDCRLREFIGKCCW